MSTRSGDIRDQSRKLSEIEPKFGRFFALLNFRGRPSENCTHVITPALRHVACKKFHEDIPTSPDVIGVHTLNFKPNFKFSGLQFFGGPLSPVCCALPGLGQSLARIKI